MLPLVAIGYVALPWLVTSFFPDYVRGIPAARLLLIASLFNGSVIGVNALWSLKAWGYIVAYQVSGAAVRALGPLVGLSMAADPLIGVSMGTACACLLQFTLGMVLTQQATAREAGCA
jgi:hypothetical protein